MVSYASLFLQFELLFSVSANANISVGLNGKFQRNKTTFKKCYCYASSFFFSHQETYMDLISNH